jgi:hypothetical protein
LKAPQRGLIERSHYHMLGGHLGITKTAKRILRNTIGQ